MFNQQHLPIPSATSPDEASPINTDEAIPEHFPPFDVPAILARINGNTKLLRKLLLVFHRTYAQLVPQLHSLLAAGNNREAERLAHSLKGDSGTLQAHELYTAVSAVELALRTGQKAEINSLLEALERALSPAIAATSRLVKPTAALPPVPLPCAHSGHICAELAESLTEFRRHLASNNLKARKLFLPLHDQFRGLGREAESKALGEMLEQLDFKGALQILNYLTESLTLTKGKTS